MLLNPQLILTGKNWPIESRAKAITLSIPATINSIVTSGYYIAGDKGSAIYKRVVAAPVHPGYFQSADGAFWEISVAKLDVYMLGAKGDGATDDSAAWNALLAVAVAQGVVAYPTDGTFLLNGARQGATKAIIAIPNGGNFTIKGSGYNCHLIVANNYTAGGDYKMLASTATTDVISNVEISGIRFDGNGSNNLVIDSGANIRGAYAVKAYAGQNIYIHDCWFNDQPGRNVINLGNNSNPPDFTDVRIQNNEFWNVGGAIAGNENQNDHSTVYCQSNRALISDNIGWNDNASFNPFSAPNHTVNFLEIHGTKTRVCDNISNNYGGGGGNIVATVSNNENSVWENNQFLGAKSNSLNFFTTNTYTIRNLTIRNNIIEIDNSVYPGGNAIFQNYIGGSTASGQQIDGLVIEGNTIRFTNTGSTSGTSCGMILVGMKNFSIQDNTLIETMGSGIQLINESTQFLSISNGIIDNNRFVNCGKSSGNASVWGLWINNTNTNTFFYDFIIGSKNSFYKQPQAVGASPLLCRGIRFTGGGYIQNIRVEMPEFINFVRTQQIEFSTTTNNSNINVVPRQISVPRAVGAQRGLFTNGYQQIVYADPISSGYIGQIPSVSGAASEGTWAANTAYVKNQWIKTATNIYMKCLTGGQSGALTPTPVGSDVGKSILDGTVIWLIMDSVTATFASYGAIV